MLTKCKLLVLKKADFDALTKWSTTTTKRDGFVKYAQWKGANKDVKIDEWFKSLEPYAVEVHNFRADIVDIGGNHGRSSEGHGKDVLTHTKHGTHTSAGAGAIDFISRKFGNCEYKSLKRGGSQSKIVQNNRHNDNDHIVVIRELA